MSEPRKPAEEYVVIRHRPGHRLRRIAVLLVVALLAAVGGYVAGLAKGGGQLSSVAASTEQLTAEVDELRSQYRQARQSVVNLERGRLIDEHALREARNTMVRLETRIAELEADLTFYRNIMAPSEAAKGLQVDRFTLLPGRDNREFGFKLVLTQAGDNKSYISGVVAVNVIGNLDGEKEVIALRDLSEQINELGVAFRFRYFQDIEGKLTLPEHFEPLEIQVVAQAQGRKAAQAERTFNWQQIAEY